MRIDNWISPRRHLQGYSTSSCEPLRGSSLLHTLVFRDWLQRKTRGNVVNPPDCSRFYFWMQPISSCISPDRPPRYEVITAGEYIKGRLQATYNHWGYLLADEMESEFRLRSDTLSGYLNMSQWEFYRKGLDSFVSSDSTGWMTSLPPYEQDYSSPKLDYSKEGMGI